MPDNPVIIIGVKYESLVKAPALTSSLNRVQWTSKAKMCSKNSFFLFPELPPPVGMERRAMSVIQIEALGISSSLASETILSLCV